MESVKRNSDINLKFPINDKKPKICQNLEEKQKNEILPDIKNKSDYNSEKVHDFRKNHFLLLQHLTEKNKLKEEIKKLKQLRVEKIMDQNKVNLGLNRVKSKINNILPTIPSDVNPINKERPNSMINAISLKLKKKKKKRKKLSEPETKKGTQTDQVAHFHTNKMNITHNYNLKNCNSIEDWKRRNGIDKEKKVFICFNGYPDMKKSLLSRGWVENHDQNSIFFDYKFALSSRNIDHEKLLKNQIVNHFQNNGQLSRKVSLCKNLQNIKWFRDINVSTFYPRCFDLSDMNDVEMFVQDFKLTKAESILKDYYYNNREISENLTTLSIKITNRRMKDINDLIDLNGNYKCVSSREWDVISEEEKIEKEDEMAKKRSKSYAKNFNSNHINVNENVNLLNNILSPRNTTGKSSIKSKMASRQLNSFKNDSRFSFQAKELLDKMAIKDPQFLLNGSRNIWIMKPSGLSRGRGIKCVDSLSEILSQIKSGCNQYVIQKYIENPLIISGKKFDIRQWVMVTNFNPLTIWLYQEPYIRFSAEDYNPENISNIYSHLTNNSIAVKSKKFESSPIVDNMWDVQSFILYLKNIYGYDVYEEKIKSKIIEIVIFTLESVQDIIINRKNSHEIFGFDLMIDEMFNIWLIEVNSSPCMEYSTDITKRLVKLVMEDTCKVVVDYKENNHVDTGLWKLIHKAKYVEDSNSVPGLNLLCEGFKIKLTNEI